MTFNAEPMGVYQPKPRPPQSLRAERFVQRVLTTRHDRSKVPIRRDREHQAASDRKEKKASTAQPHLTRQPTEWAILDLNDSSQAVGGQTACDEPPSQPDSESDSATSHRRQMTPEQLARELARLTSSMTPADRARIVAVLMGQTAEDQQPRADLVDD